MRNNERSVYQYDLHIKKRAVHAPTPDLSSIINALKTVFDKGTAFHERAKGTVVYRIGDMKVDTGKGLVQLLIRRSDMASPDAVYSHHQTGKLRLVPKTYEEGGDSAAHIVISTKPQKDYPDTYMALLEGVPNISHYYVQALLNRVIKIACDQDETAFQYPDPSGAKVNAKKNKMTSFIPFIMFKGYISPDFAQDLDSGKISDIELIGSDAVASLSATPYLNEKELVLKLAVTKKMPSQGRLQSIINAVSGRVKDFPTARIHFKDKQDKSHSVEVDIGTGTPLQEMYVKSVRIRDIDPPLAQSTDILLPSLTAPMTKHLLHLRQV